MTSETEDLAALGWGPFFQSQLSLEEIGTLVPARVMAVHRDAVVASGAGLSEIRLPQRYDLDDHNAGATVGDWVLTGPDANRIERLLERRSLFRRKAAGRDARIQSIAANIDTLFIVSSCNLDFNAARIERYLALAGEAGVEPLLLLTKGDLADDPHAYIDEARKLAPSLLVTVCDARDPAVIGYLEPWLGNGQTVALVGSSGVGKTTLMNTLSGETQATADIREDDAKGRHTTTVRSLHRLPSGAWLVDTPGMRELQLADAREGVDGVFADIVELASECRFSDCRHETEPGCAVRAAVAAGQLDEDRLDRFRKLRREDAFNTATIAEKRARSRDLGKLYRSIQRDKRNLKGGD